MNSETVANEIISLYRKFGDADYIGEPVSQMEHMSQAAQLAIEGGYDDEIVLAAFFHDIGHICVQASSENSMGGFGTRSHEQIGADFLRAKGFSERIAQLVENHVKAKRYLTFRYPEYYASLSEASKKTLEYQGGKMTEPEARLFEVAAEFKESILLRRWDELAKEPGVAIIDFEEIKSRIKSVLAVTS
ncbi:phosphodiesterase [Cytophagales bacterium WSM2-2]|nr:phosphodiesterase [Cytophagales bacterium WSM2-2]